MPALILVEICGVFCIFRLGDISSLFTLIFMCLWMFLCFWSCVFRHFHVSDFLNVFGHCSATTRSSRARTHVILSFISSPCQVFFIYLFSHDLSVISHPSVVFCLLLSLLLFLFPSVLISFLWTRRNPLSPLRLELDAFLLVVAGQTSHDNGYLMHAPSKWWNT